VKDVAINADTIAAIGSLKSARGKTEINAKKMAVAPGFINMLSHCEETLIADGKSQSDIRQGVTLEVFGESSMGPINDSLRKEWIEAQGDIKYPVPWLALGQYLEFLEKSGISTNVASFVGAGTVRANVLGYANRAPTSDELEQMKDLVRTSMKEGAMGLTNALIYTPDYFASTDEIIEMAKVASEYGGMYTSHIRSEGNQLLQGIDELIKISREAKIPAEIYHFKAAGVSNWWKMDSAIARIEAARASGLRITADMYTYIAGATGLDASMPPWVQEGGYKAWAARLKDPEIRRRVKEEMRTPTDKWENLYLAAGSPEKMLLVGFKNDKLKPLTGKTLAEVCKIRGTPPEETMMDLVVEDGTRVGVVYFLMSEDNVRKILAYPWVAFGSDAESEAPEGVFLKSNPHPRAYGNFARLLGKYVRDEKVIPLQQAIRRLTSLPAANLNLKKRGTLKSGYYADVVIFDPKKIQDHATFDKPHQYATGMKYVFVNGAQVLSNGKHTGAKPGRIIRGPGWKK
jgi:N-acyl-D-amino-acid deacylase